MLRWPEIGFEEIAVDLLQSRGDLLGTSPARILFVSARFRCSPYGIWDFCALRFFAAMLHKPAAPDEVFPGHRPVTGHPSSDISVFREPPGTGVSQQAEQQVPADRGGNGACLFQVCFN